MEEEALTEHILDSLEKFYTFLRPHTPRKRLAVKDIGDIKVDDKKPRTLDLWHFSALILISILTEGGKKSCLQANVEKIFLWKYPTAVNKVKDKQGVMNTLEATALIERRRGNDRRFNSIILTQEGKELIAELREARRADVKTIISQLGAKSPDEYATIAKGLTSLSDKLWIVVLTEVFQ